MRKIVFIALMALISFMAYSQTTVKLTVDGNSMTATLTDNEATRELTKLLEYGDITIHMSDYGGFEKVGALPQSLPTSNTQITTVPGDIMLYQGNQMVVFYGSNSWSYTRLGKIDGATANSIRQFLGTGDIILTLSLNSTTGISDISSEPLNNQDAIFDLAGRRICHKPLAHGIYIINGKKTIIKK